MARGIFIFGSAGAGKATLGAAVARELGFAHINTDDLFWRTGMKYPYTLMLPREDRVVKLMDALWEKENFVLSGTLDTISDRFEPMFDLAVYLTTNTFVRLDRLQQREFAKFGERILEGGDLYPMHMRFLDSARRYDSNAIPNADAHAAWAGTLPCPVLRLSGEMDPQVNARLIVKAYQTQTDGKKDE
ncbi:MAG: AAA family ATPase [Clostridia bacterium]|nr:AAA family ATPase [Clostridia bacterium]